MKIAVLVEAVFEPTTKERHALAEADQPGARRNFDLAAGVRRARAGARDDFNQKVKGGMREANFDATSGCMSTSVGKAFLNHAVCRKLRSGRNLIIARKVDRFINANAGVAAPVDRLRDSSDRWLGRLKPTIGIDIEQQTNHLTQFLHRLGRAGSNHSSCLVKAGNS